LARSPFYTNDGKTAACGAQKNAPAGAGRLPKKTMEEGEEKEERNDYRER
jgi:hypothetical protein